MTERADALHQVAHDQVRVANQQLASRLRRLADAATQAAADLAVAEPGQRVPLALVHSRYQSAREASAMLAATRSGAAKLHLEADEPQRSGSAGSGRA